MTRTSCALLTVWAAASATATAADTGSCKYHEEPSTDAPAGKSRVTILAATPAEGGEVQRDTVIGVDVEYQVADFARDTFSLDAQFPTSAHSSMSPGKVADRKYLQSPSGKVHLCVPLEEVYEHDSVRWPLTMRVTLHRQTGPGGTMIVARGQEMGFNALDIPQGALERQAREPPPEFDDALMKTSTYLRSRAGIYRACIARYPARQPALTKAYRAWEARHRASIDFISEVQFERLRAVAGGRRDVAVQIEDAGIEAVRKSYDDMPAAKLETQCKYLEETLAPEDDPTEDMIGDELGILRKHYVATDVESPQ